jgi:hypothetical protein
VTSATRHGSVIGHLSHFIYINDVSSRVKTRIRLFNNDAAINHEISEDADVEILSSVINKVHLKSQKWELELNLSKCTSIHLLYIQYNQHHTYTANGINIKTSKEVT